MKALEEIDQNFKALSASPAPLNRRIVIRKRRKSVWSALSVPNSAGNWTPRKSTSAFTGWRP